MTNYKNGAFENPFNAKNEAVQQAANSHKSQLLADKAASIYADLPYEKEYKGIFALSNLVAFGASLISFFTAYFAVKYILSFVVGGLIASISALILCVSFELLKGFVWKITAKNKLRYQKTSIALILILVFLHAISLLTSCFGAYLMPNDIAAMQHQNTPLTVLNSSEKAAQAVTDLDAQTAQIDAQITAFIPHLTKANGKKSSSTAADISALRAQKDALLSQKEKANSTLIAASETEKVGNEALASTASEARFFIQMLCIGIAVFFELIYIFAVLFIFYYLFRVHIDSEKSAPTPAQKAEKSISTAPSEHPSQKSVHSLVTAHQKEKSAPEAAPEPAHEPARKIGFFLDAHQNAPVAQTVRNTAYTDKVGANPDTDTDTDTDILSYTLQYSNGVPVAKVGQKLYTIDRVRSNYSASKHRLENTKKTPNKHGARCEFWARVLADLAKFKP